MPDITHTAVGHVQFGPFTREIVVTPPPIGDEILKDVHLQLRGRPDADTGVAPTDVRIYIDQFEVTNPFVSVVKSQLDENASTFREQYQYGIGQWLRTARALERQLPGSFGITAHEETRAQQLLNIQPLSGSLIQLGDRTHGWGGNLGLFNYLFWDVKVPPISAKRLLMHTGRLAPNDELRVQAITISAGHSPSLTDAWSPAEESEGGLQFAITWVYENFLEQRLDHIANMVSTAGPLHARITNLRKAISALSTDWRLCTGTAEDQLRIIAETLKEIRAQRFL